MTEKQSFEEALQKLEAIVKEMESGSLTLEESFAQYEAGIKQSAFCITYLDQIEKKISVIRGHDGILKEDTFEAN